MKRVQFDRYGASSEMYMGEYEPPGLKADEVRVKVKAAAINPLDWKQRQGALKLFMSRRFPKGMGSDFAGIVEAVGKEVRSLRVGEEVFGTMHAMSPGAFAEAVVTASRHVAKKPPQLSFPEAACLPIPATTAWAALIDKAKVSARPTRILINGCTGAVGSMAVQLALAHHATVAGTCSAAGIPGAKRAGVEPVFDYAGDPGWQKVERFDVIFDTAGTLDVGSGLMMLRPGGIFLDINPTVGRMMRGMLNPRYKLAFATMGTARLQEIAELAAAGKLKVAIGLERRFSDAVKTIVEVEEGLRVSGRVVLVF